MLPNEKVISHYSKTGKYIDRVPSSICLTISSPYTAAVHMCQVGADNGLEGHIDDSLENDKNFEEVLSLMPVPTPEIFVDYKTKPKNINAEELNETILKVGKCLSKNQYLFHGGTWEDGNETITTQRPLSTSFCPQIAMRNAEYNGKAFDAGRIDLLVLKVLYPKTPVFVYNKAIDQNGEKEVLFASGARLKKLWTHKISDNYKVMSKSGETKNISTYVIMIEIS